MAASRTPEACLIPRGAVRPRLILGSILLFALLVLAGAPDAAQAAPCTPPVVNPVACENTKAGTPANQWWVEGSGDPTIQGFATQMSVNKGDTIAFKVKSATSNYRLDIYRLGYYGNDGARMIQANVPHTGTGAQPDCASSTTMCEPM